jgi:hypothetical protein
MSIRRSSSCWDMTTEGQVWPQRLRRGTAKEARLRNIHRAAAATKHQRLFDRRVQTWQDIEASPVTAKR